MLCIRLETPWPGRCLLQPRFFRPLSLCTDGWMASFSRIEDDNSGTIPAEGIRVSSPHGVAAGGRGGAVGEKKAKILSCKLMNVVLITNPTRVDPWHFHLA